MSQAVDSAIQASRGVYSSKKPERSRLIKKVMSVGYATLASRLFGLVREILMGKFLGKGLAADLFFTAYKLPNSLRKIFAEGALSAALVPTCVQLSNQNNDQVDKLISLAMLIFQGILLGICGIIFWKAPAIIQLIAPGWFIKNTSQFYASSVPILGSICRFIAPAWYLKDPFPQEILPAIMYVRIVIGFILCLSSSALLAAAFQTVNHFFIPAISPVILNIVYISGLLVCLKFGMGVSTLCGLILFGGIVQALLHIVVYFWLGFRFQKPDYTTWLLFKQVLKKFIPCLLSMSVMEVNLFISTSLATYLASGTIASIYYANRFMGIPLGVFAVALSTILLPYFSKISLYAPKRLGFYLFEAAKLIWWVTTPLAILMVYLSDKIFLTLFVSEKFTIAHAYEAALLLSIFSSGLFFFSLNKILLNIYYALHETKVVTWVCLFSTISNYGLSKLLIHYWGSAGLVMAFVFSGAMQSAFLALILLKLYQIELYGKRFFIFAIRTLTQSSLVGLGFACVYKVIFFFLYCLSTPTIYRFFDMSYGFWLIVTPLSMASLILMLKTIRLFKIKLLYLG